MKYCLIGEKLGHSYSAEIHNLNGFDYTLKEIPATQLKSFVLDNDYDGYNVTIPYKKQVIPYLDELDEIAKITGAVNTVVNVNGKKIGYNTDVFGMRYMIKRKGVTLKDKNVLILGSGGTSNTAQTLCMLDNAKKSIVVSRKGQVNYQNCYDIKDVDIIINTTPVGMYPSVFDSPIDISKFSSLTAVFDCIYNPFTTKLLQSAKELGLIYSDGLPMLVEQALFSQDIWKNFNHDKKLTEEIILKIRREKSNLVLFGMPSSGKSTIGKEVAKVLNREFIDLDEYVTKTYGKTPSEIITEQGEKAFREIETNAVKEVCKYSNKVISLGGGTVIDPQNVKNLSKNGVMIYIKRPLEKLISTDRPLSKSVGIENLYNMRKEIYENAKDAEINNDKTVEDSVKEIIKVYETACNKWC